MERLAAIIEVASVLLAIIGIPFALIIGACMWLAAASCASQSDKMTLNHSWGPLQDCMVQVDGHWMPLDSYKVVKVRP